MSPSTPNAQQVLGPGRVHGTCVALWHAGKMELWHPTQPFRWLAFPLCISTDGRALVPYASGTGVVFWASLRLRSQGLAVMSTVSSARFGREVNVWRPKATTLAGGQGIFVCTITSYFPCWTLLENLEPSRHCRGSWLCIAGSIPAHHPQLCPRPVCLLPCAALPHFPRGTQQGKDRKQMLC